MIKRKITLLLSMVLILLISCSKDDDIPITETGTAVTDLVMTAENTNILTGTTAQLSLTITPADATNKNVEYTSSDTAIATVDSDGLVSGIAIGTVTITVTSEGDSAITHSIVLQIIGRDTNQLTAFSIDTIEGTIIDNTIAVALPLGADITALTPVVTHTGISITPAIDTPQDFTTPVTYTVTAENGNTQQWVASVNFTEQTAEGSEFITTWEATEITIPTNPAYTYNYNVDWDNDGSIDESGITGDITHTFATSGKHTIRISGVFPALFFSNDVPISEKEKIISLDQWGTGQWLSMERAFSDCHNLLTPATDIPDLTKVTNLSYMFSEALVANPDVSRWDVSKVTNMSSMFDRANVANPDVSQWDVSNVTNMSEMFGSTSAANPEVSQWDVSKVTNMNGMFYDAMNANPDVSGWDVSEVTSMSSMFYAAMNANPDVSKWDVSNVTNMSNMFYAATNANPDVSKWEVSNVISMFAMFLATNANPDVSKWDVSNVTNMSNMFYAATNANPDVSQWDVSKVTRMSGMFDRANLSSSNYEALLINFANQLHRNNVSFHAGTATATAANALAAKQQLITDGWIITDGSTP